MMIRHFALIWPLLISSAACSSEAPRAEGEAEETAEDVEVASADQALTNQDNTFYRPTGTNKVFMLYGGNQYCWVYEPGQLDALAGYSKANGSIEGINTYTEFDFRQRIEALGRVYAGHCRYPGGCFRRDGDPRGLPRDGNSECEPE